MNVHVRTRRIVLILVLLALILFPFPPSLADSPDLRTISIVSTSDIHGALLGSVQSFSHGDMVGGMDWVAGYINLVREENLGGVLYLDAGDLMQGTLESGYCDGASMIEVLNAMGVSAMAVGNHEFDWGQDVLQARADQADFPFLAANVFYAKEQGNPDHGHGGRPHWAKPYVVREVNGIKVGIIGIANPETPSIVNPVLIDDLVFTDPVQAVNDVLPEVEAEGANLVVVLAHIGGYYPGFNEGLRQLACGLDPDRVDLIVSGHTHTGIANYICGIPVVQAYSNGTAFSRVDFTVDLDTGEVVDHRMNSYPPQTTFQTFYSEQAQYHGWDGTWRDVYPDPVVAGIVAYHVDQVAPVKAEVVGNTLGAINLAGQGKESAMGDWVADIMREYVWDGVPSDFAFTNSGGLRTDIDAGDITYGEVYELMPFDNTVVMVELTGAEVRQVLEEGITGAHGVIQVSGLKFAYDNTALVGHRIVGDVTDLEGVPLDPADTYRVAVNDFMAGGGDDYGTLKAAADRQQNTYVLVRDLIVDWCKEEANWGFTPPDPEAEQRITISTVAVPDPA